MNPLKTKTTRVVIGGMIQGIGMGLFLFPQAIPSGGAGGIAILLNHFFNMNIGLALWLVNFILLLFGITYLGRRFALWTIFGMTIASLSINFVEQFVIFERNLVYDVVFGSVYLGIGVGMLMREGVSNGGFGVLAYLISFKMNILPGKPLFFMNCFIFFLTGAIINWKIILLAFVSQWLSTTIVDFVIRLNREEVFTLSWQKKT